ncbi:hypothetical protein RYH80_18165 [Halobaculum sp. MBLA0147]
MSTHPIDFTGHDNNGRYYELTDDAPIDGVTINEVDGTITFHGASALTE